MIQIRRELAVIGIGDRAARGQRTLELRHGACKLATLEPHVSPGAETSRQRVG